MQRLKDYLTKEGWKKDLEETLSEDRPLSMYNTAKELKTGVIASVMTPVSYCIVTPILATVLCGAITYGLAREAYQKLKQ